VNVERSIDIVTLKVELLKISMAPETDAVFPLNVESATVANPPSMLMAAPLPLLLFWNSERVTVSNGSRQPVQGSWKSPRRCRALVLVGDRIERRFPNELSASDRPIDVAVSEDDV
jgi:hypothetical protein